MGLELGKPGFPSRSVLLWSEEAEIVDSRISLVGCDFSELSSSNQPFALFILVGGSFTDDYACYREMRDAAYGFRLNGLMIRFHPSRQSIWLRIARRSLENGFSAAVVGSALIQRIQQLDFVNSVEILFVAGCPQDVAALNPTADMALAIVGALTKMEESMKLDCSVCEYASVCADVEALRRIRNQLRIPKDKR